MSVARGMSVLGLGSGVLEGLELSRRHRSEDEAAKQKREVFNMKKEEVGLGLKDAKNRLEWGEADRETTAAEKERMEALNTTLPIAQNAISKGRYEEAMPFFHIATNGRYELAEDEGKWGILDVENARFRALEDAEIGQLFNQFAGIKPSEQKWNYRGNDKGGMFWNEKTGEHKRIGGRSGGASGGVSGGASGGGVLDKDMLKYIRDTTNDVVSSIPEFQFIEDKPRIRTELATMMEEMVSYGVPPNKASLVAQKVALAAMSDADIEAQAASIAGEKPGFIGGMFGGDEDHSAKVEQARQTLMAQRDQSRQEYSALIYDLRQRQGLAVPQTEHQGQFPAERPQQEGGHAGLDMISAPRPGVDDQWRPVQDQPGRGGRGALQGGLDALQGLNDQRPGPVEAGLSLRNRFAPPPGLEDVRAGQAERPSSGGVRGGAAPVFGGIANDVGAFARGVKGVLPQPTNDIKSVAAAYESGQRPDQSQVKAIAEWIDSGGGDNLPPDAQIALAKILAENGY